jgi:GNAT superfamily N-acetyltransferase
MERQGREQAKDRLRHFGCNGDQALMLGTVTVGQTYVSCHSGAVVGFYSLAVGSVEPSKAAPRVIKGIPQHPVPVMILASLAVDLQHQGAGLGKALLKDALLRTAQAADIAGIRALLVHAKDEPARQ